MSWFPTIGLPTAALITGGWAVFALRTKPKRTAGTPPAVPAETPTPTP
jgi:hypothetical protein